jgi:large subunit ribosomal protein L11
MTEKKQISALVTGGEASAGPPLGPQLGPLGVNVLAIVNEINKVTGEFKGMRVPVKIEIDQDTKQFSVSVGMPTTSALLVKEASIPKGASKPGTESVGDISFDQVVKIAKLKMGSSYANTLKSALKEVLGSAVSMGLKVNGSNPKDLMKEVDEGKWDDKLK